MCINHFILYTNFERIFLFLAVSFLTIQRVKEQRVTNEKNDTFSDFESETLMKDSYDVN